MVALGFAGWSFVLEINAIFAELDINTSPQYFLASANRKDLLLRVPQTPPPSLEIPNRSLAHGEKSGEVLLLQQFLKWRGFWPSGEELTGYFGDATLEYVKKYQQATKIEPEGIVGPMTREAWKKDIEQK